MSMKKRTISILCTAVLALSLASCGTTEETQTTTEPTASPSESASSTERVISLSDDEITLDGETIAEDDAGDVTVSHDICIMRQAWAPTTAKAPRLTSTAPRKPRRIRL